MNIAAKLDNFAGMSLEEEVRAELSKTMHSVHAMEISLEQKLVLLAERYRDNSKVRGTFVGDYQIFYGIPAICFRGTVCGTALSTAVC